MQLQGREGLQGKKAKGSMDVEELGAKKAYSLFCFSRNRLAYLALGGCSHGDILSKSR